MKRMDNAIAKKKSVGTDLHMTPAKTNMIDLSSQRPHAGLMKADGEKLYCTHGVDFLKWKLQEGTSWNWLQSNIYGNAQEDIWITVAGRGRDGK